MTNQRPHRLLIGLALLLGLDPLGSHPVETATNPSDWSGPANLGPVINTAFDEVLPHISKDGLSLYFSSNRPGFGGYDIWVSQRATRDDTWGPPMNLGPTINTNGNDRSPALSRDGHFLFFATNRPGGFGLLDIWVSYRSRTQDDLAWEPPVNLGAGVNGEFNEFGPSFLENEDIGLPSLFFGSNRPGVGSFDIYISHLLPGGQFGPGLIVAELATPHMDFRPTVRPDGLELFFDSDRPNPPDALGLGLRDVWTSKRSTVADTWSAPTNLGASVNSESNDMFPALSSDGTMLVFASDRPGGFGSSDLYLIVRAKKNN
jgi:Tol biopolymer transport system component